MTFKLTSKNFKDNDTLPKAQVYNGLGASGLNLSPDLSWENAPENTESFAIICHDPDAPKENGWYHWFVINIAKTVNHIKEGAQVEKELEGSKELITDFQTTGYNGAAPPKGHGKHRYIFSVVALDTPKLDIKETVPNKIEQEILKHALEKAQITALYERHI